MEESFIEIPFDRLRCREPEAWDTFAEQVRVMLGGFLRGMKVDHHASEEIIQDCLFVAWRRLEGLRDPQRLGTWMRTIARNRFLTSLRRRGPKEVALESAADVHVVDPPLEEGLPGVLRVEVHRLSGRKRLIIELRILGGYSPEEVEEMTGIPRARQRRCLYNALSDLRARLCGGDGRIAVRRPE